MVSGYSAIQQPLNGAERKAQERLFKWVLLHLPNASKPYWGWPSNADRWAFQATQAINLYGEYLPKGANALRHLAEAATHVVGRNTAYVGPMTELVTHIYDLFANHNCSHHAQQVMRLRRSLELTSGAGLSSDVGAGTPSRVTQIFPERPRRESLVSMTNSFAADGLA